MSHLEEKLSAALTRHAGPGALIESLAGGLDGAVNILGSGGLETIF